MESVLDKLMELGFSRYEAKAYAALLGESPVTGHRLAKLSGVPPSSIYEVAGRLVARGAAMVLHVENTDRYAPVPAVELLERLRRERGRLIASLKEDMAALTSESDATYVWNVEGYKEIVETAEEMIGKAKGRIRLAPLPAAFPALHPALGMAVRRGVRLVIHGSSGLGLPESEVVIAPMAGVALRRVEETSLILIVDGEEVLMGEWADGLQVRALRARSSLVIFLAQRYLRTDLYLSRILTLLGDRARDFIHGENREILAQCVAVGWLLSTT